MSVCIFAFGFPGTHLKNRDKDKLVAKLRKSAKNEKGKERQRGPGEKDTCRGGHTKTTMTHDDCRRPLIHHNEVIKVKSLQFPIRLTVAPSLHTHSFRFPVPNRM